MGDEDEMDVDFDDFTSSGKRTTRRSRTKQQPSAPTSSKKSRKKRGGDDSSDAAVYRDSDAEFEALIADEPASTSAKKGKKKRGDESDGGRDSDAEFEALMAEQEKEEDRIADAKAEKKSKRAAEKAKEEEEEGADHHDLCEECQQGGELLLCDTCPRVYHCVCLDPDMQEPPEGKWSCPICETEGPPPPINKDKNKGGRNGKRKSAVEEPPQNHDYCKQCGEGGDLLLCDNCVCSYHFRCVYPLLEEMPEGNWHCPRCTCEEPDHKPHKILIWRWVEIPVPVINFEAENDDDVTDAQGDDPCSSTTDEKAKSASPKLHPPIRIREFYIKWKHISYWHCSWVHEIVLNVWFKQFINMYWVRLYGKSTPYDIPPEIDDGSREDLLTGDIEGKEKESDVHNLEERFFRYGVKPEWLQPMRVLNHKRYKKDEYDYLIKWRDQNYDQSTWEQDDLDIPGLEELVVAYWDHRHRMFGDEPPKKVLKQMKEAKKAAKKAGVPKVKKGPGHGNSDLRKKLDEQPEFLDITGGKLHPYQLEGLNWLRHSWVDGTSTILADEMGLGKTIQTIAFLYALYKEGHCTGPFLVSAPLSTITNWEREFEFWAPEFYVLTYVGDKESRAVIREHEFSFVDGQVRSGPKATKIKDQDSIKFNVLLTSYELVSMDSALLKSVHWRVLVIDEAHRLKNQVSKFFKTLMDYNIDYKLLLTGTPLQNNLEELFALLNFLEPDEFSNMEEFMSQFTDISKDDQIQKLHSLLGPHMLRRLKADVMKGIPGKTELIVRVDMTPIQKKYYKYILTRNFDALNTKTGGGKVSLINILMDLRKCCNHPYLFPKAALEAPKLKTNAYEGNALIKGCGKLVLLSKMLRRLKEQGHRVLIFSQMTRMLDVLEDFMEHEGYLYERIDGSIMGSLRQEAIDRFNAPNAPQLVFLLSTRAGGLGINLATADTVIIYDSDWNPHNDIQALSRAHRIGQVNKVMIYRFVVRNSVEERVTSVAKKKMLLTHLVVRAGMNQKTGPSLTKQELDDVLKWGTEDLFKEDSEKKEGEESTSEQQIVWEDNAVEALLDRGDGEGDKDKEHWSNEYLGSFKVAQYVTKETEEVEEEEEREVVQEKESEPDPEYWERLLKHHYDQQIEDDIKDLGKGKRQRKSVNYALAGEKQQVQDNADDSDYTGNESVSEKGEGSDEEEDENKKKKCEKLPPLLSRVNGYMEVLGFNLRQRRAFYNNIMRWGMPPHDVYCSQWLTRDLKVKSEKCFRAYASLFMRHLCEPNADPNEHFNDGVPKEGLNRQHVLTRIGIMALLRKKVQEYELFNGEWSMPEVEAQIRAMMFKDTDSNESSRTNTPKPIENVEQHKNGDTPGEKEKSVHKSAENEKNEEKSGDNEKNEEKSGENEKNVEKSGENEKNIEKSGEKEKKKEGEDLEKNEENEKVVAMEENEKAGENIKVEEEKIEKVVAVEKNEESEEKEEKIKVEEEKVREPRPPHKFNIMDGGFTELHTLWMHEDVACEGQEYEIWNRRHDYWLLSAFVVHGYAIYADLVTDPRLTILVTPFKDDVDKATKFMQRRYKLLEQSLVVEEQLRRVTFHNNAFENKEDGTQVEFTKEYMQKNTQDKRNHVGIFHKALNQLEEVVSDLKSDVAHFPATLTRVKVTSEKGNMDRKKVLLDLMNKEETAKFGQSALDSPSPFANSVLNTQLNATQSKYLVIQPQ